MSIPAQIRQVLQNARCIYNKADIEQALDRIAAEIHQTLSECNPVLLTVLKGGAVLTGNLLPRLDFPLEIDNIHATRYQGAFQGSTIEWKYAPSTSLKNRTVLILDDILDLGITLQAIIDYCHEQGCAAVYTAVLVNKNVVRDPQGLKKADFVALDVENYFVFGYGLDYKEYLRNAPGIYEVAPEDQ